MTTARTLYNLTGGSVHVRPENGREFASITRKLETEEKATEWLRNVCRLLRALGWEVTATSNGSRFTPGFHHQASIDIQRGTGPLTQHERHMIATCTGRD